MRILVTGCHGYIGPHLCRRLASKGHALTGIDRRQADVRVVDDFIQGDLLDAAARHRALESIDCVCHLAAARADWGLSRDEYFRDNVEATRALIRDAAGKVSTWVFYSSVAVYGSSSRPLEDDTEFSPEIPYGESKAQAEALFGELIQEHPDTSVIVVRPSAVFGRDMPEDTNIYRLVDAIHRGKFLMIGDGSHRKTTSYVDNLVAATTYLMDRREGAWEACIYVDQPVWTTGRLVQEIYRLLDRTPPPLRLPLGIARPLARVSDLMGHLLERDFPITASRIEKFCTSTHFVPRRLQEMGFRQPVSNERALQRTVTRYLADDEGARNDASLASERLHSS